MDRSGAPIPIHARPRLLKNVKSSRKLISSATRSSTKKYYEEKFRNSHIADRSEEFPVFSMDEVTIGKKLGEGGFGEVFEIRGFDIFKDKGFTTSLTASNNEDTSNEAKDHFCELNDEGGENRNFIATHCIRNGKDARYAFKRLSLRTKNNPNTFPQGLLDINTETRILSSLKHHPNIIKLRAVSKGPRFHDDHFLVLDRLYDNLETRLKFWKKRQSWSRFFSVLPLRTRKEQRNSDLEPRLERMCAAFDLSSAVSHLHKHRIIHRDLKPDNVGFDIVSLRKFI